MIGRTISHYRIVEKLGEGGMGVVYLAEDTVLGRRVAIKTLTTRGGDNKHFRTRFLREARAVSALSHPHIAHIYDYGETEDDEPYIVMELIKGTILGDLMAKEALTIPRAIEIIKQVAEALGEAHRQGIVHRDIKPSNVAINERGSVKVLDFGLAKQIDINAGKPIDPEQRTLLNTQTREGVIVGTPMYLSPEQALGVDVDARSDLFALGGLLYECIAGKPAFSGGSPVEICAQIIRENPPPPSRINPDVPEELDHVAMKALAKKPDARYQSADDMIADLDNAHSRILGLDRTVTRMIAPGQGTHLTGAIATLSDIFKRPRLSIGYVVAGIALLAVIGSVFLWATRASVHVPKPEAQRLYDRAVEAMREGAYFRASKILGQAVQEDDDFALAHARLAECWTELDSSDKAQAELIRTLTLVPDPSILPHVDGLRLQAVTKTVQRDFAKAVDDYRSLVAAVPTSQKAFALFDLGRAYEKNEQPDKAIESYEEATRIDSRRAPAFLRLGTMLGRRAKYAEAYTALDQAYKLFDIDTNIEGLTEVLLQRAVVLALQGRSNEARAHLLQALDKSGVLENKDKRIKVLLNLSNTEIIAGNADQAQQYSSQGLELAKANGLDNLTMQGLIDIGHAYLNKGNFAEADRNFNEALRLAELYKGERSKARALLSLASLRSQQGDANGARAYFQRALPFYERGGYRKEVFQAYVILGRAEAKAGDFDSARQRFAQLLHLAQQSGDQQSTALAEEGLGRVFLNQRDFPNALKHYEISAEIYKSLNANLNVGYTSVNRAEALWQLGRYDNALAALSAAQAIAEPAGREPFKDLQAGVHLTKARLFLSQRKINEALAEAKQTLEITGKDSKATVIEVGNVSGVGLSLLGRAAEGRKRCEESLRLARELNDSLLLSATLLANAQTALWTNDAQAALTYATEAQQRFATFRQIELESQAFAIQALAAEKTGDKTRAQQLAEQSLAGISRLEKEWGKDQRDGYLSRPDLQQLQKEIRRLAAIS